MHVSARVEDLPRLDAGPALAGLEDHHEGVQAADNQGNVGPEELDVSVARVGRVEVVQLSWVRLTGWRGLSAI